MSSKSLDNLQTRVCYTQQNQETRLIRCRVLFDLYLPESRVRSDIWMGADTDSVEDVAR